MMTKRISCLCILLLFVLGISSTCQAKSVFAVASHSNTTINAYLVDGDELELQGDVEAQTFAYGATGLCAWPGIERMFVTYEASRKIAWGSTKTLKRYPGDQIDAPESNLAGVVADEQNGLLYAVGRGSGRLYIYEFDTVNNTLVLTRPNGQSYQALEGLDNAYGLALDEDGGEPYFGFPTGLLYVANGTNTVRYYNTMTWELVGSVDMGRGAVGIDVDGDGHLYAGGYMIPEHNHLIRYDLNGDPNDTVEKDMGYDITDITIDRDTGILYTTTRQIVDGHTGAVEVYDVSGWSASNPNNIVQLDIESGNDFSGPAGITIGSQYKPSNGLSIYKFDDVTGKALPGDIYSYDIMFGTGPSDKLNVVITDKLPENVNFVSADPNDGTYYPRPDHTYVWELGNVVGGDPNSLFGELTVQVNDYTEPNSILVNRILVESDACSDEGYEKTLVECWGGDVIYVDCADPNSSGPQIGTSWATAYNDLNDALTRAAKGCGYEIWVASGIYSPGDDSVDSFKIFDGVEVYGGFAGNETLRDERDWIANKTVLTGGGVNNNIVTMGYDSLVDGCIIEGAVNNGIYGETVDFELFNCVVEDNARHGIRALNGNLIVECCTIRNNDYNGAYLEDNEQENIADYQLTVENCKIYSNKRNGVDCFKSALTIVNSEVYHNGNSGDYYGIKCLLPPYSPEIRNCTIVDNTNEGVSFSGSYVPDVRSSILYYNNADAEKSWQTAGIETTYFCCVYDPNNPPTNVPDDDDNITCEPEFACPNVLGNYHLAADSVCKEKGDSSAVITGETDIDRQDRIYNIVDIGADEVTCSEVSHWLDENGDGIVNYTEFAGFANSWGMTNNDPNWSDTHSKYDYVVNSAIDVDDLVNWPSGWCWTACWFEGNGSVYDIWLTPIAAAQQSSSMMMPMSIGIESTAVETQPAEESFFTSEEIIDFFESLLDDEEVLDLIDKSDLKKFIKSLESDLFTDLP